MEITFEVFNVVKSAKTWKNTPRRGFKMRMRLDGQVECSAARFLRGRDKNWGCQKGPMPRWHANGPTSLDGGTDSGQMCHLRREKHGAARRRLLYRRGRRNGPWRFPGDNAEMGRQRMGRKGPLLFMLHTMCLSFPGSGLSDYWNIATL